MCSVYFQGLVYVISKSEYSLFLGLVLKKFVQSLLVDGTGRTNFE